MRRMTREMHAILDVCVNASLRFLKEKGEKNETNIYHYAAT
jgi:hypothetical protein